MLEVFRITSDDYHLYREACQKVRFCQEPEEGLVGTSLPVPKKKEFLDLVQSPNFDVYVLKDQEEVKGLCKMSYEKGCYISHFSVTEYGRGLGTFFFQEIEKIIRLYGFHTVYLHCTFERAGKFWIRQGFHLAFNDWTYIKMYDDISS